MKTKSVILSFLLTINSLASTTIYQSFQSSYISNSGAVTDKNPIVQTGFDTYISVLEDLDIHIGSFLNYSSSPIDGWYSKDRLFNETDVFLGTAYSDENQWLGLDYEYWYYPHIIGDNINDQHVIHIFYQYYGTFIYTLSTYYYINDAYNYLIDINPRIGYKYKLTDELSLRSTIGTYYRFKDTDRINGFNSCNAKFELTYKYISVFYQKWIQVDSRLDTDYNDNLSNDCYGIIWSLKF